MSLTPKKEMFCREYIIDLNATRAAIRAGYSEATARSQGNRLLTNVDVQERIQSLKVERESKLEINALWVLKQAVKVHERCMQAEPVLVDGEPSGEFKFEHAGANKALEIIGKHVSVQAFADKVISETTVTVKQTLAERLKNGSKR